MNWLAAHPDVVRQEDTSEGSGFFTYWDATEQTFRQVYFEDEISVAKKYDYAIATGLSGVGIWTLDNDRGYSRDVRASQGQVLRPDPRRRARRQRDEGRPVRLERQGDAGRTGPNVGNVPEGGSVIWRVLDRSGHLLKKGSSGS